MRYIFWLVLLGSSVPLYAQTAFPLDSLPVQGTVLNQGWKWQAGDKPAWATADFDDRRWKVIDPTQDISQLPLLRQTRLGWMRLHLQVDSALLGKVISMLIDQQVASQIYLNGQRIGGFGRISNNPDSVEAYNPSGANWALWQTTHFQLGSQAQQVLAVRFALQPALHYMSFHDQPSPFFFIKLHQADQRNQYRVDSIGNFDVTFLDYFKAGLFLVLALLHLLFFIWYPLQRVYLWFGLYCLLSTCTYLLSPIDAQYIHSALARTNWSTFTWTLVFVTQPVFLLAVYSLTGKRIGRVVASALTAFGISVSLYILQIDLFFRIALFIEFLLYVESARQLWLVGQTPGPKYRILSIGAFLVIVFLTGYVVAPFLGLTALAKHTIVHLSYNLAQLSLPICMTLFLASRFAQTYRSLAEKLVQVEALSAQTLAQEQEKQQLLASQNELLERQVNARTAELSQSLAELKQTQNQLIQKEKMASLGELTAGIAHEIQNPLNFVNNFAEVSTEVVDELIQGPIQHLELVEKEAAQELLGELTQNLRKIAHHGGRAATIVQGMLEHSRSSTSERRSIDLNALLQEYLTIAYQSYRTTHSLFNCQRLTQFDEDLEPISAMPQELGRVLLNLFNNAFYAVEQRQETAGSDYQPMVRIQSRQLANGVQVRVQDNGSGIDEAIRSKIFQPFFTTKPTGQGTGLGLSLSYDIITKGHGGELYLDVEPGRTTVFTVFIPTTLPTSSSHPEPAL